MICAYVDCDNDFNPKTHNQKYCSDECCRTATNIKIKEAYYEKKARLAGKERICSSRGCSTRLSRYNENNVCGNCDAKAEKKEKDEMFRRLGIVPSKVI
jgi:hypothetical protein